MVPDQAHFTSIHQFRYTTDSSALLVLQRQKSIRLRRNTSKQQKAIPSVTAHESHQLDSDGSIVSSHVLISDDSSHAPANVGQPRARTWQSSLRQSLRSDGRTSLPQDVSSIPIVSDRASGECVPSTLSD